MKTAHLEKIESRRQRVLGMLLPEEVARGDVADPDKRLRDLVIRLGGRDVLGPEFPVKTAVANIRQLLETDIPELMDAVRQAQGAPRRYCKFCGERRLGLIVESRDEPFTWECRDLDGCETREARRKEQQEQAEREVTTDE